MFMKHGLFREMHGYIRYTFVADNADAFMARVFKELSTDIFDIARAGRGRISYLLPAEPVPPWIPAGKSP